MRGAASLLFLVAEAALDRADPAALAALRRDLPLVYVGNQYDRDDAFDQFFAPAARAHRHLVAGKWSHTGRWRDLTFAGRVPFTDVDVLYRRSVATVLLLPDRYIRAGQVTQRLFEAVLAGCLPLAPATLRGAARFVPADLIVDGGADVTATVHDLAGLAGSVRHAELLAGCIRRLDLFRLSRQLDVIDHVLARLARQEVH